MNRRPTPDIFADAQPASDDLAGVFGKPAERHEMPVSQIIVKERRRLVNMAKAHELADSIQRIGLLEPLVVREDGTLIAGRHRLEALRILAWEMAPVRVAVLSDLDAELAEIDENLIRNELTILERGEHLARRKEIYEALHPETKNGASGRRGSGAGTRIISENETVSFSEDTAAKIGASRRLVEQDVRIATRVADDVRNMIRSTPVADSKRELLTLTRMDADTQRRVGAMIQDGVPNVKEAVRQIEQERIEASVSQVATPWLIVGDFSTVSAQIPDASVDLIFTDPPYDQGSAWLYGELARIAERVLRPGGILLAYSGQMHLPQIYASMGQHLQYLWTCAIGHSAGATWFRKWHLLNQWKPVLMYGKPPVTAWWYQSFADYVAGGKEKSDHAWQQSLAEAEHYISAVCPPGGVVLDPFTGSGTTLLAAKRLGMQYIGIEIDPATAARAKARVEEIS